MLDRVIVSPVLRHPWLFREVSALHTLFMRYLAHAFFITYLFPPPSDHLNCNPFWHQGKEVFFKFKAIHHWAKIWAALRINVFQKHIASSLHTAICNAWCDHTVPRLAFSRKALALTSISGNCPILQKSRVSGAVIWPRITLSCRLTFAHVLVQKLCSRRLFWHRAMVTPYRQTQLRACPSCLKRKIHGINPWHLYAARQRGEKKRLYLIDFTNGELKQNLLIYKAT